MTIEFRITSEPAAAPKVTRSRGGFMLSGHAAVFYDRSDPGTEFEVRRNLFERILPGAFDQTLADNSDVLATYDHEHLLGRTRSGTLRLRTDSRGLRYEIDIPDTAIGRDLVEHVRRGDVCGSSFGFASPGEAGERRFFENGRMIRELRNLRLRDVGPATVPAYPGTDCTLFEPPPPRATDARSVRRRMAEIVEQIVSQDAHAEEEERRRIWTPQAVAVRARLVAIGCA